jgi:transposase
MMNNPQIQLWAEDEVHFQRHTSTIRMWAPKGHQPKIFSASTRQKVGYLGAINLKTGRLVTQTATTFNAETFGEFLQLLLQNTRGMIFLILDNAKWHRARELQSFFFKNRHRLCRVFLPPYSPELNPIERVWRITRRKVTHNRYFETLIDLEYTLSSFFAKWNRPNSTLKLLCANI